LERLDIHITSVRGFGASRSLEKSDADHSSSSYFGLDVGLGFYLVYLVR
jgi:hypothetical protein